MSVINIAFHYSTCESCLPGPWPRPSFVKLWPQPVRDLNAEKKHTEVGLALTEVPWKNHSTNIYWVPAWSYQTESDRDPCGKETVSRDKGCLKITDTGIVTNQRQTQWGGGPQADTWPRRECSGEVTLEGRFQCCRLLYLKRMILPCNFSFFFGKKGERALSKWIYKLRRRRRGGIFSLFRWIVSWSL